MSNLREILSARVDSAKERVDPDGAVVSGAIAVAANVSMLPIEAGIISAIRELSSVEPNATRLAAVAASTALNIISAQRAARAYKEKGYGASPGGTILYGASGKALTSSILDHAANFGLLTFLNPINAIAIYNNDSQLLADSVVASSIALPLWNIPWNQLIIEGKVDPFVKKIGKVREKVFDEDLAPNSELDYHRFQRAMRER